MARTLVLVAVAAVPLAVMGPAAERATDWLADGAGVVRDTLDGATARATLFGSARIIGGDRLEVRGTRVRLHGIDAPESAQRCRSGGRLCSCGRDAARALARRIGSRPFACGERDRDRYGRIVAVCQVAGTDVGRRGLGLRLPQVLDAPCRGRNGGEGGGRGIWRGDVVAPWDWGWDWRWGERLAGGRTASQRGSGRCTIKGNIGKGGARIYHVPGGRFYNRTRIDTASGERWFCSEAEARAAGWRRSRQ